MAYFGELHMVECFKKLEYQYFSDDGMKGSLEFSLLLYHEVKAGGDKLHDNTKIALLIQNQTTSRTILRKYYFSPMILA